MFSVALRTWIASTDKSLRTIAKEGGISHSSLSRWLSGSVHPSDSQLSLFCKNLRMRRVDFERLELAKQAQHLQSVLPSNPLCLTQDLPKRGDWLKAMRISKGRTQNEVADFLAVCQGTVSKWETGTSWPEEELQTKLFDFLNLDASDRRMLLSRDLCWQGIEKYDLHACKQSVRQYTDLCSIQDEPQAEAWGLALTHRLRQLSLESVDANRWLAYLLVARAYWFAARLRSAESMQIAQEAVRLYSSGYEHDLTTSYAYWAAARPLFIKSKLTSAEEHRLKRWALLANRDLPGYLPYGIMLRASVLAHEGECARAMNLLDEVVLPPNSARGDGCFDLGPEYFSQMIACTKLMFGLKCGQFDEIIDAESAFNTPVFNVLNRAYKAGAHLGFGDKVDPQTMADLRHDAQNIGMVHTYPLMMRHVQQLVGKRFIQGFA